MKKQILFMISAMAVLALPSSAALAQFRGIMPAHEAAAIVRSQGFVPISPLMRRGDSYVLRAAGPDGREMRVIVAARSGDILSVTPVVPAGPPGGLGPYERADAVPPPIIHEGERPMRRPLASIPNPPPRVAHAPAPEMQDLPPVASQSELYEERGEHGLLPPPPERFPPRATAPAQPAAKPKPAATKPAPVKRAAATPLPKPRPNAEAPAQEVKRWGDDTANKSDDVSKPAAPAQAAAAPAPAAAPASEGKVDARSLPH